VTKFLPPRLSKYITPEN